MLISYFTLLNTFSTFAIIILKSIGLERAPLSYFPRCTDFFSYLTFHPSFTLRLIYYVLYSLTINFSLIPLYLIAFINPPLSTQSNAVFRSTNITINFSFLFFIYLFANNLMYKYYLILIPFLKPV